MSNIRSVKCVLGEDTDAFDKACDANCALLVHGALKKYITKVHYIILKFEKTIKGLLIP